MNKIMKFCFEKWWKPILFWLVSCLIFGLSEMLKNHIFSDIALVILGLGLLIVLISAIYQFAKRKWLVGVLNLGIFAGTIYLFFVYLTTMLVVEQGKPDNWADNLEIPTDIPISVPVDLDSEGHRPDSLINAKKTNTDFQLYNSFQPGLYEYDFWTGKIESGTIYLKAFEITQEQSLSAEKLALSSSVKIHNPTDSIMRFGTTSHFTIYEGDWGKPYAARIEVWFKPDNDETEQKLFTKNYKIEGWMR